MVVFQSDRATNGELLLEIDARSNPEISAILAELNERWVPPADGIEHDDVLRSQYLMKVLADGLWMHDHVHEQVLTAEQREALPNQILQMLE